MKNSPHNFKLLFLLHTITFLKSKSFYKKGKTSHTTLYIVWLLFEIKKIKKIFKVPFILKIQRIILKLYYIYFIFLSFQLKCLRFFYVRSFGDINPSIHNYITNTIKGTGKYCSPMPRGQKLVSIVDSLCS